MNRQRVSASPIVAASMFVVGGSVTAQDQHALTVGCIDTKV
jgi:hypothetical protein